VAVAGQDGFEIAAVYRALADYYAVSGRPGLAIPLFEEAIADSLALRYYGPWEELSLELVGLYQRLGLVDHARDRIAVVLRFFERLGFSLDSPPDRLDMNTVVFLALHATQIEIRPDAYQDPEKLRRLYRLLVRSAETSPEVWGLDPSIGYRYAPLFAPFAIRLAELGDLEAAREIRSDIIRMHRRNRSLDPFVVANEKKITWAQMRLGRDLHRMIDFPFAIVVAPFTTGINDRPRVDRRYLASDSFRESVELARIDLALAEPRSALDATSQASTSLEALREFYARLDKGLATKDGIEDRSRALDQIRAQALERLGRHAEAAKLYEENIAWSERERASLPPELRVHFFRGRARAAYQGSIRCSLAAFEATRDPTELDRVLAKAERLRARGFQDLLGLDAERRETPTVTRLTGSLEDRSGILQFLDLETKLATILLTQHSARVHSVEKTDGWDAEVFRMRNRLAESSDYDAAAFARLGAATLGFASDDLSGLSRLVVTTDGAISALPPGILPYAPGVMLQDDMRITLVPSLSLWLASRTAGDSGETSRLRALVIGDPAFAESEAIEETIGKDRLAMRGGRALAYFERLPETAEEARAVVGAFPEANESSLLLSASATESRIKQDPELARYSHLHFATHGVIGNDLPNLNEPALVMAWEEGEDGFLTAREVADLDLRARLTVLSACNTGNGEYFAGEGLMGMGRAFMEAGSARVIVSLWPVESFSTQRLMELFYAHLARGESEDRALWLAQRDLRETHAADLAGQTLSETDRGIAIRTGATSTADRPFGSPFYWSPFVLISSE